MTRPDDIFTLSSSPGGRSEWIVEARRRNKLEKRINRCLAERQTDPPTLGPDTHTHTHAPRHGFFFFFFFLGLYWIGMQSWGERRSGKDLAYKWCPLFDPLGWEGGLVGGWMGRVVTNISVCEPRPHSSSSQGGESDQLQEKWVVVFCWWLRGQTGYDVVCVLCLNVC